MVETSDGSPTCSSITTWPPCGSPPTAGEITSTTNHPFYVEGRGWLPVGELSAGDQLHTPDGQTVEVVSIQVTGRTQTVHNLQVEGLHNYHVVAGHVAFLVHNSCGFDDGAGRWRDLDTGRFTTRPTDPSELVHTGSVDYNDVDAGPAKET